MHGRVLIEPFFEALGGLSHGKGSVRGVDRRRTQIGINRVRGVHYRKTTRVASPSE